MMFEMNRRNFLRSAVATGAYLTVARSNSLASVFEAERRFAPIKVARNRIIREVVGLRPFRAEGFVVDAERVGNKLLIHNYGHGGAGITLSWGTASLALDLARDFLAARASRSQAVDDPQHITALPFSAAASMVFQPRASCNAVFRMGRGL
jgi:glycine/D-amino acid oxidase-like deaminating enzyme